METVTGSLMDGFAYITKIWRRESLTSGVELTIVAGKIVTLRDRDYRVPPAGSGLALRQAELAGLLDRLDTIMQGCPAHLIIDSTPTFSPM